MPLATWCPISAPVAKLLIGGLMWHLCSSLVCCRGMSALGLALPHCVKSALMRANIDAVGYYFQDNFVGLVSVCSGQEPRVFRWPARYSWSGADPRQGYSQRRRSRCICFTVIVHVLLRVGDIIPMKSKQRLSIRNAHVSYPP